MVWYQLTYASVEKSAERSGGWGIVASTPGLTAASRERLLSGVVTRIEELVPTDEFAHRRELDARVRNLTYRPEERGGTWWHAVVAGKDATGRPGNVFTHAVTTDRFEPGLRPVDLWRSNDWLTPFGAVEVASSELSASVAPGPVPESGVDFALRQPQTTVEAVLSAVLSCFQHQRALVLAVNSCDEFIDWLRAVSSLTSSGVAAQIPFCTFVRADSLATRTSRFEVLGMPREDLPGLIESLPGEDGAPLVLDIANLPEQAPGQDWEHLGQHWTSGERWQDAYFLLTDGDHASIAETLRCMEEISAEVSPKDQLSPEWPLTLALLHREGAQHNDVDAIRAEWQLLRPFDGLDDPVLVELLRVAEEPVVPTPTMTPTPAAQAQVVVEPPAYRSRREPHTLWDSPFLRPENRRLGVSVQSGPLLAVLETAEAGEREFVAAAILLNAGIARPHVANPVHQARVADLLIVRDQLPSRLVELLVTWQRRYQESNGNQPEQASE